MKATITLILFNIFLVGALFAQECDPPADFATDGETNISWTENDNAESYRVQYREDGAIPWKNIEINENTYDFIEFEECVRYEVRVRTICMNEEVSGPTESFSLITGCKGCSQLAYCTPVSNTATSWIEAVTLQGYTNTSGTSPDGYENFSISAEVSLAIGDSIDYTFTIGYAGFNYSQVFSVFIDLDEDGEFAENEFLFSTTLAQQEVSGRFGLPISSPGTKRLRIKMDDSPSTDPCSPSAFGEIEDYCLELYSACDVSFEFKLDGVSPGEAAFSWEDLEDAEAYNYRYKKTSESEDMWTYQSTINPMAIVPNLDDCDEYEIEIRGVCANDTSAYKNNIVFPSYCPNAVIDEDFLTFSTYPNPWNDQFQINLELAEKSSLDILLYDLRGKTYPIQTGTIFQGGEHTIVVDNQPDLQKGLYILTVMTDEHIFTKKILKL